MQVLSGKSWSGVGSDWADLKIGDLYSLDVTDDWLDILVTLKLLVCASQLSDG